MSVLLSLKPKTFTEPRLYWRENSQIFSEPAWTTEFDGATRYPSPYDAHLPVHYSGELEFIVVSESNEPQLILSYDQGFSLLLPTE